MLSLIVAATALTTTRALAPQLTFEVTRCDACRQTFDARAALAELAARGRAAKKNGRLLRGTHGWRGRDAEGCARARRTTRRRRSDSRARRRGRDAERLRRASDGATSEIRVRHVAPRRRGSGLRGVCVGRGRIVGSRSGRIRRRSRPRRRESEAATAFHALWQGTRIAAIPVIVGKGIPAGRRRRRRRRRRHLRRVRGPVRGRHHRRRGRGLRRRGHDAGRARAAATRPRGSRLRRDIRNRHPRRKGPKDAT